MERPLVWIGVALIVTGVLVIGMGVLLGRGGRLMPGDVVISRPGFTFVLPIVTSIILSILLTLVLWFFASLRR